MPVPRPQAVLFSLKVEELAASMDRKAAADLRQAPQTMQMAILQAHRNNGDLRGRLRGEWTSPPDRRNRR